MHESAFDDKVWRNLRRGKILWNYNQHIRKELWLANRLCLQIETFEEIANSENFKISQDLQTADEGGKYHKSCPFIFPDYINHERCQQ